MKFVLLLIGVLLAGDVAANQRVEPLRLEWSLQKQDGTTVKSSDFQGKPLILHFWATWCPYCKKLQPGLDKIANKYKSEGLEVLAVSINEEEGADPQGELKDRQLTLQTVVEGEDLAFNQLEIKGTPTTVFISPEGKVLGQTMQSDPDDPQWEAVAKYLVSLKAK